MKKELSAAVLPRRFLFEKQFAFWRDLSKIDVEV